MPSNISVSVTADIVDLQTKFALASSAARAYGATQKEVADAIVEAGGRATAAQQAQLEAAASGYAKAREEMRQYRSEQQQVVESERRAAEAARESARQIEAARAAQNTQNKQEYYGLLGGVVPDSGKSAASSAAVFMQADEEAAAQMRLAAAAQLVRDRIDPLAAIERRYGDEVARVANLVRQEALSEEEGAAATRLAATARDIEIAKLEESQAAHAGLFAWLGKNRMAAMELEHSARAMADGLAAGISPVRLLSMEGPRLAEALSFAGLSTRSLLMIGGSAAAIAGVAVALGEVATAAEHTAAAVGTIQAAFDGTGRGGLATQAIDQMILRFRELPGVTEQAAEEMIASMARQRDLGVESYDRLMGAAVGFARATGREVPQAMNELLAAIGGGVEGLERLDQQYDFLSAAQLQEIERLELSGHRTEAYGVALDALDARFGHQKTHMSEAQEGAEELRRAWEDLTGQVGNEGPWSRAIGFMDRLGAAALRNARDIAAAGPLMWQPALAAHALFDKPPVPAGANTTPAASPENDASGAASEHGVPQVLNQDRQVKEVLEDTKAFASARRDVNKLLAEQAGLEEAINTVAARQPAVADELRSRLEKVNAALAKQQQGPSQMGAWKEQLDQQLEAQNKFGKDALAAELQYWQSKQAAAHANVEDERAVAGEIYRIRSEMASAATADGKRASEEQKRAAEDQLRSLEQITSEAERGSDAQVTAAQAAAQFAKSALITTEARIEAEKQLTVAIRERADAQEADRDKPLVGQVQGLQRQLEAQLSAAGGEGRHGLLGTPEQEQEIAAQIVATDIEAIRKVEAARMQSAQLLFADDPAKAREVAQEIANQTTDIANDLKAKLVEINARTTDEIKAEWDKLNNEIADGLASVLDGALSNKKHALGDALRQEVMSALNDVTKSIGSSLLGHLESGLGINGQSPGGLLQGVLGQIPGVGGAVNWLFGGAQGGAGGAGGAAGTATLTAAGGTLESAGVTLETAAISLESAAGAMSAGQIGGGLSPDALSSIFSANDMPINIAGEGGGIGSFFGEIGSFISSIFAFAEGTPYVGNTGIALIHEGERIIPANENAELTRHFGSGSILDGIRGGMGGSTLAQVVSSRGGDSYGDTHATLRQENHFHEAPAANDVDRLLARNGRSGVRSMVRQLTGARR